MRRVTAFLAAIALTLIAFPATNAQEATPMTGSPAAEESLLAGLGYPEIVITTDGTDFTAPAEIEAGRYRLVVENTSDTRSADIELFRVPDVMTRE